jgi:hypothetical protein
MAGVTKTGIRDPKSTYFPNGTPQTLSGMTDALYLKNDLSPLWNVLF